MYEKTMSSPLSSVKRNRGKCLLGNWVEERAVAVLDPEGSAAQVQKSGHKGILTLDLASKMESVSTSKASYIPPETPAGRHQGTRGEVLQEIREKVEAEFNSPPPETDFCSTTRRDFTAEGFVPAALETTQVYDYRTDQAVTFWSENRQRIQRTTPVHSTDTPFKRTALFTTPITERLNEPTSPAEN